MLSGPRGSHLHQEAFPDFISLQGLPAPILTSSTGIPSPPLALFVVRLPKAHLTSHSRMSGSRWVITSLWLSGSWRSFLYSSSVSSCHLFLISSASVRSIPFLFFIEPISAWNVPLVSLNYLKRSLVFPILLFSCISLHWSLRKTFLSFLAILWNSAFTWEYLYFSPLLFASLLFTAICKAFSDNHFAFLHFFSMGMVLIPVSCSMSQTSVHSSSSSLSIRSSPYSSWAISNPERWCCESAALNTPANLENSAVATGLEKVSFHSNP